MTEYCKDVELNYEGILVATRDLQKGELVCIPLHLSGYEVADDLKDKQITTFTHINWYFCSGSL